MSPFLLKIERKRRGWSQAHVAESLGVSPRTLRRWEQGLVVPYPYYRERLCALFDRTAEELGLPLYDGEDSVADLAQPADVSAQVSLLVDSAIPQALESANSLLGRESLLLEVKQRLLQGHNLALMALDGLPGIGETALAGAIAMDQEIQAHFRDGILWAGLGSQSDILGVLSRWGKLLEVVPSQVENLNGRESWRQALRAAIGSRRLLIIIDDAQTSEDVQALRVGGAGCVYLLTTRLAEVAFTQQQAIVVPQLKESSAIALLAQFVPELVEQDVQGAQALVQAADGLPLTLCLMGNYVAAQDLAGESLPLQAALALFQTAEERVRMGLLDATDQEHARLAETMPLSLLAAIALCDQQLSPQAHAMLCTLANVFRPKPQSFSEEAALAVSQQPFEVLDELWDAGLLESCGPGRYTLHHTITDYIHLLDGVPAAQPLVSQIPDVQVDEHTQETISRQSRLSFPRRSWGLRIQMKNLPIVRPFKRLSWSPLVILSIILLILAGIIAVLPVLMGELVSKSTLIGANYGLPVYTLTIENPDTSSQGTIQHLQDAFNAVYPQLVKRFALDPTTAPKNVMLAFASHLSYPSVISGTTIILNPDWLGQHLADIGILTHQLTYLVLQYPSSVPRWFTTGMADYGRSVYGPSDDDDWSLPDGIQSQDSYTQGFAVTARFLVWLQQHVNLGIIDQLNHALQKGQPFSSVIQRLTHQTVDNLWKQYQAHPDITLTSDQLYRTITSRKPIYQLSSLLVQARPVARQLEDVGGLCVSNFAIQADMAILSGDGGGFIFRWDTTRQDPGDPSYSFHMASDGTFDLVNQTGIGANGFSSAIKEGLGQTNQVTIIAQKHTIYVYVNSQLIIQVDGRSVYIPDQPPSEMDNNSSNYGIVAVMANASSNPTTVRFDNIQVF